MKKFLLLILSSIILLPSAFAIEFKLPDSYKPGHIAETPEYTTFILTDAQGNVIKKETVRTQPNYVSGGTETKTIYDKNGNYAGKMVKSGDTIRFYDKNGNITGSLR